MSPIGFRTRLAALLTGREVVPEGFTGTLATSERVLADGSGPRGSVVLATDQGLWLPPAASGEAARRVPWHLVTKATWEGGALTVLEAEESEDLPGGVVLLTDLPPRRVPLLEPGRLPETVHRRVTAAIKDSQHHLLPGGGAWFVQRRVPGVGVVLHVRADPGTEPDAVRTLAAGVGEKLRVAGRGALRDAEAGPVMTTLPWDPELYRRHDDHRARPFLDLVARVGAEAPRDVVDLGCGPGHLTEVLAQRWPQARVLASDSSPEMVEAARAAGVAAEVLDVRDWRPSPTTDVVVTNAVLHWVPGHRELMAAWAAALPAGAWLAVQVPGNEDALSHTIARDLLASPAWRDLVPAGLPAYGVGAPGEYAALLAAARPGSTVDAWETTYVHPLTGDAPVLEWISGTALRPVRGMLDDDAWTRLRAALAPRLREAYPRDTQGTTWFTFRRVFVVLRAS